MADKTPSRRGEHEHTFLDSVSEQSSTLICSFGFPASNDSFLSELDNFLPETNQYYQALIDAACRKTLRKRKKLGLILKFCF